MESQPQNPEFRNNPDSFTHGYGHVRMVSSHNHTFFLGKLEQMVYQYFMCILLLVTNNKPS